MVPLRMRELESIDSRPSEMLKLGFNKRNLLFLLDLWIRLENITFLTELSSGRKSSRNGILDNDT